MKKVLITPQGFSFIKDKIQNKFSKKHDYCFTNGIVEDKKELKELLLSQNAVIIGSEKIDKEVIDSAPNLELVVRFGTSTENIDVDYLKQKGIKLYSIKSGNTITSVAKLCTTFALNYIFNIQKHVSNSSERQWKRYINLDPNNINIGLIGAGEIATNFYKHASPLGFNFFYHSRNENKYFKNEGIKYYSDIKEIIEASEILSLHVPYNEETINLISTEEFLLFNNKLLINTSRAGVVSKQALIKSLKELQNFYYFTDVLYTEPPEKEDLEIISNKNVFSTAHIGGYSESALIDVASKSLSIVKTEL